MPLCIVSAAFLPAALARLTGSGAAPADRRDALAVLATILADLEPLSFTSARNAEALAELLGLDPEGWSRTIQLLESVGAVARVTRRGRRRLAVTPERAIRVSWPSAYPSAAARA